MGEIGAIQERFQNIIASKELDVLFDEGRERARVLAEKKLKKYTIKLVWADKKQASACFLMLNQIIIFLAAPDDGE